MRNHTFRGVAVAAALVVGFAACQDQGALGPTDRGIVRVLLTDAPVDYIDSAWVDIGAVWLVPADSMSGGIVPLTDDGTAGMVNLLELQEAATAELAEAEIEEDTYMQLRLVVDSARVVLKDGYMFRDGTTTKSLKVPSGAQTGIKLILDDGDDVAGALLGADETVIVVDFDVSQSFVAQGNPHTSAGIHGMIFKPTLRVVVMDVAGSIAGVVTSASDTIGVDSLTVTAEPVGPGLLGAYQTETATAVTDSLGNYMIHFVIPGDYNVTVAVDSGFATTPDTAAVSVGEADDVTGVDFNIDESG